MIFIAWTYPAREYYKNAYFLWLQFDPHLVHDQFSLTYFWRQIAKDVWRSSTWHTFALIQTKLAYPLWSSWELNSSKWCVSFFVEYSIISDAHGSSKQLSPAHLNSIISDAQG